MASLAPWLIGCNDSDAPAMASSSNSAAAVSPGKNQPKAEKTTPQEEPKAASDDPSSRSVSEDAAVAKGAVAKPAAETRPSAIADITFDDIKFDIEPDAPFERSMLTEKIEKLGGRRIRIRGFILPSFQQTGLTQFVLVRDNLSCCFGPGAALYDCIVVEMEPGKSTDYSLYPVAVEGTFSIKEFKDPGDPEGKTLAIYHLDGESVR
jgi:hypothetical protein